MWKFYEIPILVPNNKVVMEHHYTTSLPIVYGCSGAVFTKDRMACKVEAIYYPDL